MSTSAVPAVIDKLVTMFTGAVAGLSLPQPVTVYDGAVFGSPPWDFVTVGSGSQADASDAVSRDWAALGAQTREEEFVVICYVRSWRGGTDQKETRDAAFVIFDALETALRADLSLAGTVKPYPVDITTQNVSQDLPVNANGAVTGRQTVIEFGIRVRNRY